MGSFKATLIGVSVLALLAVGETGALARGGHHGHEGAREPEERSHAVFSYDKEGGGKSSETPTAATGERESHRRTPDFGESPEGSDFTATARGGNAVTGNAATTRGGNAATGNAVTGNAAAGNAATAREDIATGNAAAETATSHMRTPTTYGSDLATSKGENAVTGNADTVSGGPPSAADLGGLHKPGKGGSYIEGHVRKSDIVAAHPESATQKSKKSKSEMCADRPSSC